MSIHVFRLAYLTSGPHASSIVGGAHGFPEDDSWSPQDCENQGKIHVVHVLRKLKNANPNWK
jgi:hypothetical protein